MANGEKAADLVVNAGGGGDTNHTEHGRQRRRRPAKALSLCERATNSSYASGKQRADFVKKTLPRRPNSDNDVYVNQHTKLTATFKKCEKLLNQKLNYLNLHGMAISISKTIRLANLLRDALKNSVSINIHTGTVQVTDYCYGNASDNDANDDNNEEHKNTAESIINDDTCRRKEVRNVSVIHVRVQRLSA